jgi:integrase
MKLKKESAMGTIYKKKLSDGKTRYYPLIQHNGRRQSLGGYRVKSDAEAKLRQAESEIARGTFDRQELRFSDFYERWIQAKKTSLKPATWVGYEHTFRNHILPTFQDKRLSEIKPLDVQAWVDQLASEDLAPATVGRCYRYLCACLKHAENMDLVDRSPCRAIILPRCKHEELSFLETREVNELLEHAREPERHLFMVLAWSGLRLGEALGLAWRHVNFKDNAIVVERAWSYWGGLQEPKTETSRRAVPLLPTLAAELRQLYSDQGSPSPDVLLFSQNGETPLDSANVRKQYEKALKAAGLKRVTMHSLRHSYASLMIACGASIKALQRALGHASATMTLNTYAHLIQEDLGGSLMRADQVISGAGGTVIPLGTVNCASTGTGETLEERG